MIRFLSAALVAVALLGSVALCQYGLTRRVDLELVRAVEAHETGHAPESETRYSLVLTPTFDIGVDPFAVDAGGAEAIRIRVRLGTEDLVTWTRDVMGGESIRVDGLAFPEGPFELFVEATPGGGQAARKQALRLQVVQDELVFADETLWTPGGGVTLSRRVPLRLEAQRESLDRGLGGGAP